MSVEPIRWDAPGPYRVAFSTRAGGVSEGPYASLNVGALTPDSPDAVVENRRRLCAAVTADPSRATMARQVHGATVTTATPTGVVTPGTAGAASFAECDGLVTAELGQPLLLVTADCVPIAIARHTTTTATDAEGAAPATPALALLHAGWRGLLAGIVANGVRALGGAGTGAGEGRLVAAVGPAIGPCCYEVGDEVSTPFRAAFGDDVASGRHLDLAAAAERALRAAGVASVHQVGLCTACNPDLFFSHRRDSGITGRQGVVGVIG